MITLSSQTSYALLTRYMCFFIYSKFYFEYTSAQIRYNAFRLLKMNKVLRSYIKIIIRDIAIEKVDNLQEKLKGKLLDLASRRAYVQEGR